MELADIVLTTIYSIVILLGASVFKLLKGKEEPFEYFLPGLFLKIIGGLSFFLTYKYYFKMGDTFVYLHDSSVLSNALVDDFYTGIQLLFQPAGSFNPDTYDITSQMLYFSGNSELIVVKIASLISLFSLQFPMTTTLLFASVSYFGLWRFFLFFYDQYPQLKFKLALATLFVPSVVFWGSGVMKDPLVLGFMGILVYSTNEFFKHGRRKIKNGILLVLSVYIITTTKAYVTIALLPALFYWLFFTFNQRVNNPVFKMIIIPVMLGGIIGIATIILGQIGSVSSKYSVENLMNTAVVYQDYHYAEGDYSKVGRGSSYSLGEYDPSITGLLSKFPAAVNVTLFRPYFWEVRSPAMILSALESSFFLVFTLIIFLRVGIYNTLKIIFQNNFIFMCVIFSIFFAFAVGFTSYNFGALVRYKIPCMGFYTAFLFILDHETRKTRELSRFVRFYKSKKFRAPSSED